MSEYSLNYGQLESGDVLEFEGIEGESCVAHVIHQPGRSGMGGMDQGTPSTVRVIFSDNTEVIYDPWVDLSKHYRRFRVARKGQRGKAEPNMSAYKIQK